MKLAGSKPNATPHRIERATLYDFPQDAKFVPFQRVSAGEEVHNNEGLGNSETVFSLKAPSSAAPNDQVICRAELAASESNFGDAVQIHCAFRVYLFKADTKPGQQEITFCCNDIQETIDVTDEIAFPRNEWVCLSLENKVNAGLRIVGSVVSVRNLDEIRLDSFILSPDKTPLRVARSNSIKEEDLEALLSFKAVVRADLERVRQSLRELRDGGDSGFFSDWFIAWSYWFREMLYGGLRFLFFTAILLGCVVPAYLVKYVVVKPVAVVFGCKLDWLEGGEEGADVAAADNRV